MALASLAARTVGFLLDASILAFLFILILIIATGGGVIEIAGRTIRARGVENPFWILTALIALRYAVQDWTSFLSIPRWPVDRLVQGGVRLVTVEVPRAVERFFSKPVKALLIVAACTCALKVLLAWMSPGFFSGDDVEIHEMSIGALLGKRWSVWELRSPFFPMTFIYPAQWLSFSMGGTSPGALVLSGRAVVALLSTAAIPLTWLAARRLAPADSRLAAFAVLLLAVNKLFIAFGSSELPRPVSSVFVLSAFLFFLRPGIAATFAAGTLLGVAVAFRFSEAVFVVTAVLMLSRARKWTRAAVLGAAAALVAAGITAAADALYSGSPLSSARAAVSYTLIEGRSSRGYQPVWEYLRIVPAWSAVMFVVLAIAGTRRRHPDSWWLWTPLALLSLLPHKESRYLIPIVPFLCIGAARGLVRAIDVLREPGTVTGPRLWVRELFAPLLILAVLHEAGGWRLPRTNDGVRLARHLQDNGGMGIAAQDFWNLGGRPYLWQQEPLVNIDAAVLARRDEAAAAIAGKTWVALRSRSARAGGDALVTSLGFARDPSWRSDEYVLYVRRERRP